MELVSAYVDGECSEEEAAELIKHLEECASCRALLAIYESINKDLLATEAEPPAALKDGVMERIRKEPIPFPIQHTGVKTKKFNYSAFLKIAAAAACLALVIYAAPQFFRLGKSSESADMSTKMELSLDMNAADAAPSAQTNDDARIEEETPTEAPLTASAPVDVGGPADEEGADVTTDGNVAAPSTVPSPAPAPSEPGLMYSAQAGRADDAAYYATITITGELPEMLAQYDRADQGDGTFRIVIPAEIAKGLLEDNKYAAEVTNENAAEALVIYSEN